jgi:hypothetical protein
MSSRFLMHRVFPPSKPPDGGYPPSSRLIVGGTQLRGSWYLSAIVRLQGFSSASPAVPPRRRSPKTVTTSPWVGRSKPGSDLGPTLSFKDLRASGSLYLSSPLERRCGRGQDCSSTRLEAYAAAVRPPGAGVVVVAVRAGGGEPPVSLLLLPRPPPIEWGCSCLRRWNRSSVCNGTLNASVFVHCGCRGLNMYVILARSRVFSSFPSTKTRMLVV